MNKEEKRFQEIIQECQKLRADFGWDYEELCEEKINAFSREITNESLVYKCEDSTFARQLCMMNSLKWE